MHTALIAGNGPDAAMVKFQNMPRLLEMDALLPLDRYIDAWPGRTDIADGVRAMRVLEAMVRSMAPSRKEAP